MIFFGKFEKYFIRRIFYNNGRNEEIIQNFFFEKIESPPPAGIYNYTWIQQQEKSISSERTRLSQRNVGFTIKTCLVEQLKPT